MLFLEATNIKKYFSNRLIIEFDEFKVYSGDKIGIVGQNGSGKTTLMNILSGELEPEEGFIRRFCDIAYIRQFSDEMIKADGKSLREFNLTDKVNQNVFSGGEKTRIRIANALSGSKLMLFADEPTANLDCKGVETLMQKLLMVDSFIIISHDRVLLDNLCNRIIEISNGELRFYNGNYTSYKQQREIELQYREQEYEKYVTEKAKLENSVKDRQRKSDSVKKAPKRMGNSEARLHKRKSNEKQEKINSARNSLKTRLEKLEVKEKPEDILRVKLDFSLTNPPENKIVISAGNLSFSYGSRKIFQNADFKVYNGSKTALWGENGVGKTTLLNLISHKASDSIYIVPKARIGYLCQEFENLDSSRTVLENVMQESVQSQAVARTILARLLMSGDDVYKKVGVLSGGEKIKVSFAKLFVSDSNVLLLDEPTNYLDMASMEALEGVLCDYEGTVVFVSHDETFVNTVADRLLVFENLTVRDFEGSLQELRQNRLKGKKEDVNETERIALQMRITEIVSKLSNPGEDKETLEAEYKRLISLIK